MTFDRILSWLKAQPRTELTYWGGLVMLFVGLAFGSSLAAALAWVGGIIALESALTSYLAGVLSRKH